jgi:hypothetical protein
LILPRREDRHAAEGNADRHDGLAGLAAGGVKPLRQALRFCVGDRAAVMALPEKAGEVV